MNKKPTGKKIKQKAGSQKRRSNRDAPLRVEVENGQLIISIGVETLKYCHNHNEEQCENLEGYGTGFLITDAEGFASDVEKRLKKEGEDGSTLLTDLLDKATKEAADDGSIHTKERFEWYCDYCDKGMPDKGGGYTHTDGRCYCSKDCAEER